MNGMNYHIITEGNMETLNKTTNYQVHPEDVDIRGWNVEANGIHLGVVNDLVLDTYNMRVKYLDLVKKDSLVETNDHYLIPVDRVTFNRNSKTVVLKVDAYHFHNHYPGYSNEPPADYEEKVRSYYLDNPVGNHPEEHLSEHENEGVKKSHHPGKEENNESLYGSEYEQLKNNPDNLEAKIGALERQKQFKKIEFDRDLALIDAEIDQLRSRLE